MRSFLKFFIGFILISAGVMAHPMPNSVLLLDVKAKGISAELQWPLKELQLAFPDEDIDNNSQTLLARKETWLNDYLHAHMLVTNNAGHKWTIKIISKKISETQQTATGVFREVMFQLWLEPPADSSPRQFTMYYDAIMHQVVTHKMLIRVRQDWDGGLSEKDSLDADLGVLMMNMADNKVPPLIVNLDEGSKWKGFKSMVHLGIQHISEGTDHLLFLLVLMLPAPLIAAGRKWTIAIGTKASAIRLLKIATAFTAGHSLTLLAGAIGWLRLPSQPVEVLIALSIFIGAVHALRPAFPGKELLVASGFGLIHGLAFAATLSVLEIDGLRTALSILGFNLGIELMQLFVILLIVPWLIILSNYAVYRWIRILGALLALLASGGWIAERISQKPNVITEVIPAIMEKGQWIILALAVVSLITSMSARKINTLK